MADPLLQVALHAAQDEVKWSYAAPLRKTVTILQYAYPIVMLVFFLAAFTVRSIAASKSNANIAKPTTTGPGGKPLPATDPTRNFVKKTAHDDVTQTQKRLFEWVSLAAALTFVGNSTVVIAHALIKKEEEYWAGKATVVCIGSLAAPDMFEARAHYTRSTSSAPSSSTACSSSPSSTRNRRRPLPISRHGAWPLC
jgi:hypothetical protein